MKKLSNLIKKLKEYLPITRKIYKEDMKNFFIIINGIKQSEAQHSQMEMNLIQQLDSLKSKKPSSDSKEKNPSSFYA
jgi:hypothetical protein